MMRVLSGLSVNEEKRRVLSEDGDVLVTANPGTGKTFLLIHKYIVLVENGVEPEDILCLTYTTKAKKELEERLINIFEERGYDFNLSDINVHTFHSYTLECIGEEEVVSSNLLRYAIYDILKEEEVLNYSDNYLMNTIVPKMENLIRYVKNYGITPDKINLKEVKELLKDTDKYSLGELRTFAEYFVKIFKHYERIKASKGIDYTDMLLNFLNLENVPEYEYVLVDELQDVNNIEARISLKAGKHFIAVGDKKQAIFGFQGGSISNFELFQDSKKFVLSDNFRSSQEILDYARTQFTNSTEEESYEEELKELNSAGDKHGEKPIVYSVNDDELHPAACDLAVKRAKELKEGEQVAIIARTNNQIMDVAKELRTRDVEYSSTYFSASQTAKENIILFLKSILASDIKEVKRGLFTPFAPVKLQEAFKLVEEDDLTLEDVYEASPEFKKLREETTSVKDVNELFTDYIIPLCISHGKEYLYAGLTVKDSYEESLKFLEDVTYKKLSDFMNSADLLSKNISAEKKIIITTVHKAKGLEFDSVVYLPKRTRTHKNFQDLIVRKILETKGIDGEEELEEESERIDFVALTRAENKLIVLNKKPEDYVNEYCDFEDYTISEEYNTRVGEKARKAFSLFLAEEYEEAKKCLEEEEDWVVEYFTNYFNNLDKISFTSLNTNALKFLKRNILDLSTSSPALELGSKVHDYADKTLKGEEVEIDEDLNKYAENVHALIKKVKTEYPILHDSELKFCTTVRELLNIEEDFKFSGVIDAVFKNEDGEYLIVDWKTSKRTTRGSKYRRQLLAYKKAFSIIEDVPEDKIRVAIGYVNLKPRINTGETKHLLKDTQPQKRVINTIKKHVNQIITWKNKPKEYMKDLIKEDKPEDKIWKSITEAIREELD